MRKWLFKLLVFVLTGLLILELVFRFILHTCELPASIQSPDGFLLFDPHYQMSGYQTNSLLPDHSSMIHWTINNDGWNSTFHYHPIHLRKRPLIAVIGDSAIEGLWSDVEDHMDTWLYYILKGEFDVYAFGRHAQPLSQMMLLMERVDSLYKPDAYVMFLGHDVLFSSISLVDEFEYHYLLPVPILGTFFVAEPPRVEPSAFARMAMRSALVRYLRLHLLMDLFPLMTIEWQSPDLNARLSDRSILRILPMAGRYMLARMSQTLGDRRLLIVGDNFTERFRLYGDSRVAEMVSPQIARDLCLLDSLCSVQANIDYISIQQAFKRAYDTTGVRFEATDNRHLNGYGNYIAANTIARHLESSGLLRRILHEHEAAERLHHKMHNRSGWADP